MKTEIISNIANDMKDSLTDYQLNKLKESLIINFEDIDFIIRTDEKNIKMNCLKIRG